MAMQFIQPRGKQEESALDKIAKGIQIAQGVFGIPVEWEKLQTLKKHTALQEQQIQMDIAEKERTAKASQEESARSALLRDPNSPQSQQAVAAAKGYGLSVPEGSSASDIERLHGPLSKYGTERFSESEKRKTELAKKSAEKSAGKQLPPDKVLAVQEGKNLPSMISDLRDTLSGNADQFGPVTGRLGALNPYNEKAQTIDAQFGTASQAFGRYMEGGVLRKEDEQKYRKMFPTNADTPEVALNKLDLVERMLQRKLVADTKALKDSGYDTAGVDFQADIRAVPQALQARNSSPILPKKKSAGGGFGIPGVSSAQGASLQPEPKAQPTTVKQGGFTYTLNPKTGRYE